LPLASHPPHLVTVSAINVFFSVRG
jgi:hypothetical protein